MARLRKSGPQELRTQADNLVKKWKKSVNPTPAPAQPSDSDAAKRPRLVERYCSNPQSLTDCRSHPDTLAIRIIRKGNIFRVVLRMDKCTMDVEEA